ncbi:MAG: hypothetical protein Q8T04_02800 [Bacteroidota bacterium]|nr:hypothetical protein [Bacteroidota bacterium]
MERGLTLIWRIKTPAYRQAGISIPTSRNDFPTFTLVSFMLA